jgi:hypothetical protein
VVTLRPGTAAVFTDGMDFPVLTRMPDGTSREITTPVVAPVTEVVGRTHGACGPQYADRPCTLTEIEAARQLLTDMPAIVIWAELAAIAHLVGVPLPTPRDELADALVRLDVPLRDAAVRLAVGDAVAARSVPLASTHSPEQFAAHITADLRAIFGERSTCSRELGPWLATPFRWGTPLRALYLAVEEGAGAGRHPDSSLWESVYHRPIQGETAQEQLRLVEAWSAQDRRDRDAVETVLFGVETFSALERAVGVARWDAEWETRLSEEVRFFEVLGDWPLAYLDAVPSRWGVASGARVGSHEC